MIEAVEAIVNAKMETDKRAITAEVKRLIDRVCIKNRAVDDPISLTELAQALGVFVPEKRSGGSMTSRWYSGERIPGKSNIAKLELLDVGILKFRQVHGMTSNPTGPGRKRRTFDVYFDIMALHGHIETLLANQAYHKALPFVESLMEHMALQTDRTPATWTVKDQDGDILGKVEAVGRKGRKSYKATIPNLNPKRLRALSEALYSLLLLY